MATIEKYQTQSGATFYRVRYRKPDGRQTDKRGFEAKRDAELFAATVVVDKSRGEYVAPSIGRTAIGNLGPAWLERQRGHMRPSGFRTYESGWRIHVEPQWRNVRIADVRFSDVQAWVSDLAARRGPSIVRTAYSVLCRILDDAVRDRMLAVNPARGAKLPPKAAPRHVYLTAEQLQRLADESGPHRSLVLLLGVGGLRWGEAAALRASDVDFLRRRVRLQRNAVMVGDRVVVGSLKSHKNRSVVLPQFVLDVLSVTAAGKGRDELLWATAVGTPLGPPAPSTSWLAYAVKRCQAADPTFPRITAHALRHTAASLAIHAGANPLVVQRMLGHSSAAMTLDVYADLFESDLDAVAESVGKMWARAATSR
ncbi:MAG: tyrosine-type recombinase/integrase [Mycobacterium sp.]|uniref:tyrosine-type recombinase/integrase n=1 Tax=Mycobacterium sp. TaxID=1785 RepID=UPI003F960010